MMLNTLTPEELLRHARNKSDLTELEQELINLLDGYSGDREELEKATESLESYQDSMADFIDTLEEGADMIIQAIKDIKAHHGTD